MRLRLAVLFFVAVFLVSSVDLTASVPGDANGDGTISVGDVFYLINYLFASGPVPIGPGDANGDGIISVGDVFYLINFLFAGGPPPVNTGPLNLTGTFYGRATDSSGNGGPMSLQLTQTGSTISGSGSTFFERNWDVTNVSVDGAVNGATVTFLRMVGFAGCPLEFTHSVTAATNTSITGTWEKRGGCSGATITGSFAVTKLTSITISGTVSIPTINQTSQLTATANLSDGTTRDLTTQATWQSSNTSVVTVSSTGLLRAINVGQADIRATYFGITGTTKSTVGTPPSPPSNDNFQNAVILSGTFTPVFCKSVSGSNYGATQESGEPANGGNSVWWKWTPSSSSAGQVVFSTIGSPFDTYLAVYTGSTISTLVVIAQNDDGGGNLTSRVTFSAVAGTTYYIAVTGYGGASGSISLNWSTLRDAPLCEF